MDDDRIAEIRRFNRAFARWLGLFDEHYSRESRTPARHHPKFIVDYAVAMCRYEGIKPYLDKSFVSEAFKHLYTTH